MAPKRKNSNGGGKVEQHDSAANPGDASASDFAKTVYLVAEHEGENTAYSVFKVNAAAAAAAAAAGGGTKPTRVHTVAGIPNTARGMSFVSVQSKHGSWIVGVGGGLRAGTIIFDPSTQKTYQGPRFPHPKSDPILLSLAGEVYALSRRPRVVPVPDVDFEPWFHSLSFNNEVPIGGGVGRTYWCMPPPPPFFPSSLNPYQFRNPPEISVTSYAAVGSSHILLSGVSAQQAQQEPIVLGTYAFHVVNKMWEKVHAENLPFVGQAMPLGCGGNLFVACPISKENNGGTATLASLFHISIKEASLSTPMSSPSLLIKEFPMQSPSLSIQEFPVKASEGRIPKPLFCPLGKGRFCSVMLGSSLQQSRGNPDCPKEDQVILRAFQIENIDAILNACQSVGTDDAKNLPVAVQVKEQGHAYKYKDRSRLSHVLDSDDMPVVAALSMDSENIEVFDEETAETRGSQTTDSTIIEVPVISYRTQSGVLQESSGMAQLQPPPTFLLAARRESTKPNPSPQFPPFLERYEMAPKRKESNGDGKVESAHADQSDANEQVRDHDWAGIGSRESRDRSAYLVAAHWDSSRRYSVFKMVDLAASSASEASRKRLKRLGSFKADACGKVFTSVSSRNRAWIIGVGGDHHDTIIFDTCSKEKKKVIQGPNLNSSKRSPVLMAVGDKVYAISKFPSWVSDPDFPPWFEVLDLSKAKIVNVDGKLHLEDCSWTPLPHPPCMPWELSPRQYTIPPLVILMSCVVVGPYILVSFSYPWGTYAFDTNAQEPYRWHKIDKDDLPFIGYATPLGSIFLASSRKGPINAHRIHVATSDDEDNALKLSITILPVKYMEHEIDVEPCPCFSSLDNESFCSLGLSIDSDSWTYKHETGRHFPRQVHVNLTTYQIENPLVPEDLDETMLAVNPEVAVSSQQECTLNIASSTHGFSPFGFSLVLMDASS